MGAQSRWTSTTKLPFVVSNFTLYSAGAVALSALGVSNFPAPAAPVFAPDLDAPVLAVPDFGAPVFAGVCANANVPQTIAVKRILICRDYTEGAWICAFPKPFSRLSWRRV